MFFVKLKNINRLFEKAKDMPISLLKKQFITRRSL